MIEPAWWAAFVFTLAKGRVTREHEDWVMWHLPLCRALAYQHCALRSAGEWTVPIDKPLKEKLLDIETRSRDILLHVDDEDEDEEDFE